MPRKLKKILSDIGLEYCEEHLEDFKQFEPKYLFEKHYMGGCKAMRPFAYKKPGLLDKTFLLKCLPIFFKVFLCLQKSFLECP